MSDNSPQNHDRPQGPTTAPVPRPSASTSCSPRRSRPCAAGSPTRPTRSRDLENRVLPAAVVAGHDVLPERAPRPHPEGGARADRHAQGRGRPAGPAAVRPTALILESYDDAHGRHPHRRPQDARRGEPVGRPDATCRPGREVMLNEALNVVASLRLRAGRRGRHAQGDARRRPGARGRPRRRGAGLPDRRVASRASRSGSATRCMLDPRSGFVYERIPKAEVEDLVLEEVPDIDYEDIGGLAGQIEQIRDAVELPYLHPDLFREHQLQAAQGRPALRPARLRQDADRQGGRRVAGQARSPSKEGKPLGKSYFLNIKGPELLNKYVGETERHIRLIFQRAREKASRRHAGRGVLRRDGLAVPHPRVGRLLRRRDDDRAAAARPRSTASSGWRTSSSSAPPTART